MWGRSRSRCTAAADPIISRIAAELWIASWLGTRSQPSVFYLGDWDPAGESMFENLRDDVLTFLVEDRRPITPAPIFEKVALGEGQVDHHALATAAPKRDDRRTPKWLARYGDRTCQLEAMPPELIFAYLDRAIWSYWDRARFDTRLREEQRDRRLLTRALPARTGG
jgi:hypothetical protein